MEGRARAEGFEVAPASVGLRGLMNRVQIVHAHTGRGQTLAWTASVGLAVKRIVTRHVAFEPRHPLVHRMKYSYLCDGIIAVSQAARRAAMSAGVPGSKIETIPTGVEIGELPSAQLRLEARRAWKLER